MSDDNVVSFPGTASPDKEVGPKKPGAADELLSVAMGQFEDIIVIGIRGSKSQCLSTVPAQRIVYEMSRVVFKIHEKI